MCVCGVVVRPGGTAGAEFCCRVGYAEDAFPLVLLFMLMLCVPFMLTPVLLFPSVCVD